MGENYSLTGRVVSHAEIPDAPMNADRWWGDPPWSEFMARTHGSDLRYLVIEDSAGLLVGCAPLLVSTEDRGPFPAKAPAIAGDERAFGDETRLSADERAEYDALRARLDDVRPAQYPSVALTARGANHGVAIALDSPVPREEVFAALPALVAAAAAELGCRSHAILNLDDDTAAVREAAAEHGYTRVVSGAETVLDIPVVSSHEEYFDALPSRRRTRLRKEAAQYAAQGLRTVVRTGRDAITEELVLLQARLRAKHGMPADPAPVRKEFGDIRDAVGDSAVVLTAERDGRVVGFVLCLRDKDRSELLARSAGFDYDEVTAGCYLALTYHEVPMWAADHGVRRIWYGSSTYEAKRARGCTLLPLSGYLRFDGPDGDLLARAARWQTVSQVRELAALGADITE